MRYSSRSGTLLPRYQSLAHVCRGSLGAALAFVLSACAAAPSTPPPRETVAAAVETGIGGDVWLAGHRDEAWRQQRLDTLLAAPLDIAGALQVTVLADYEIIALLAELDAQRAATGQAGLLPNPSLRFMAMRPEGGRASGVTMLDYGLMQELVDTLTRGRRLAIAESAERAAAYRTAGNILLRLWSAQAAYAGAVAARERAALWAGREKLALERAELARVLADRGLLAQDRAAALGAQAAEIIDDAQRSSGDAEVARARLAETLGLASAGRVQLPDALPEQSAEPESAAALREAALRLRLDLLEAQATALRDEDGLELVERWRYLVRLGVGAAGEREADGTGGLGLEIAATVPLFDQGQARLSEAQARLTASRARIEARQRQVQAGVDRAFAEWQREHDRIERLARDVRPRLATVLALSEQNYRDGLNDRFAVLDAADALLALDIDRLDAREALWLARIELARQTGTALPLFDLRGPEAS